MELVVLTCFLLSFSSLLFFQLFGFGSLIQPNPLQISISPLSFPLFSSRIVLVVVVELLSFIIMDAKGKNKVVKVVKKESTAFVDSSDDEEYREPSPVREDCNINTNSKKKKAIALKKVSSGGGGSGGLRNCQVEKCMADLSDAKPYHRRHKVCEVHAKAQVVLVSGVRQRFCQQCSRFHELPEFDETKRSCRRRLAGHNERRRKNATESNGEGSSRKGMGNQLKDMVCGQVDDQGRIKMSIQENATYKHFQIR